MTGPERDPDVDAWLLARRPQLRAGDAAHSLDPPEELDQLILDRARRELRQLPAQRLGFFRSARFSVPVSIAATLLLSFTLVLQFNRYENRVEMAATRADSADSPLRVLAPPTAPVASPVAAEAPAMTSKAAPALADAAPTRASAPRRARDATPPSGYLAAQNAMPAAARAEATMDVARSVDAAAERAPSAAMGSAAAAPPPAAPPAPPLTVTQWWADVLRLRTEGRSADAARELAALRKAYPDFVAPTGDDPAVKAPEPPPSRQ